MHVIHVRRGTNVRHGTHMVPSVVMYAVSRALPQLSSPMSSSVAHSRPNSCAGVSTTPARTHAQEGRMDVDGRLLSQETGSGVELVPKEGAFGQR